MLFDNINIRLKRDPLLVRGFEVKGALETSPSRKQALRSFFEAGDWVRGLNPPYNFEECARSLELWGKAGCVKIGWHHKQENEWQWDIAVAATCGTKLPIDIDEDPNATPRPEDQEPPNDDDMQGDADIQQDEPPTAQNEQNEGEKRAADETNTTTSKKAKVLTRNTQ